jgi:hypothetical protein
MTEDMLRAARMMQDAAAIMARASSGFDNSAERHQRGLDDWLQRFEAALEKDKKPIVHEELHRVGPLEDERLLVVSVDEVVQQIVSKIAAIELGASAADRELTNLEIGKISGLQEARRLIEEGAP